jgi:NADH-quinone oxidoreductase subunit M
LTSASCRISAELAFFLRRDTAIGTPQARCRDSTQSGLAAIMPIYTGVSALAFFASMGLPGLSGFISEVLVLLGSWQKFPVLTIIGASGVILTAGYLLWTIQRVYLGPINEKYKSLPDINGREMFTLVPLGAIVILVGIYPNVVLDFLRATLDQINQTVVPHLHL